MQQDDGILFPVFLQGRSHRSEQLLFHCLYFPHWLFLSRSQPFRLHRKHQLLLSQNPYRKVHIRIRNVPEHQNCQNNGNLHKDLLYNIPYPHFHCYGKNSHCLDNPHIYKPRNRSVYRKVLLHHLRYPQKHFRFPFQAARSEEGPQCWKIHP